MSDIIVVQPVIPVVEIPAPGPQGPAGAFTPSDIAYTHTQASASATWTINQTVFSDLDSASTLWTSNHRLRGIACAYIRLEYDANVYMNGIPNISFKINGKKVYDPRTTTTVFPQNPALCLADYLCDTRYGLGADYATEIDETALTAGCLS